MAGTLPVSLPLLLIEVWGRRSEFRGQWGCRAWRGCSSLAVVLSREKVWTWLDLATVYFCLSSFTSLCKEHRGSHSSFLQEEPHGKGGGIFVVFLFFLFKGIMDFTLSSTPAILPG